MSQGERSAAAGPADASFDEFVAGSSAHLFTLARLLTGGHRAEAEDLLQGAYERAYRHWKRVSRREDPERYVWQIPVNASVDRWRRLRRRPEEPMRFPGGEPPVADHAAEIADRDLLLRGLAALAVRQRAVLVLRYFEDLTGAQTAEALGCSVGTVKSQAARALARLRQLTGEGGPPDGGTAPAPGRARTEGTAHPPRGRASSSCAPSTAPTVTGWARGRTASRSPRARRPTWGRSPCSGSATWTAG
jgi:RNA polymerase sigma-70 factor (sigma-E family)